MKILLKRMMKKKYEVRWYEFDLTNEIRRKFFTEVAANFYAWWIEYKYNLKTRILKHG